MRVRNSECDIRCWNFNASFIRISGEVYRVNSASNSGECNNPMMIWFEWWDAVLFLVGVNSLACLREEIHGIRVLSWLVILDLAIR